MKKQHQESLDVLKAKLNTTKKDCEKLEEKLLEEKKQFEEMKNSLTTQNLALEQSSRALTNQLNQLHFLYSYFFFLFFENNM